MEQTELLERCRRGDALAWEALVRNHQGRVYGLALHYLADAEEARDAAQEVFVRVYRNLDETTRPPTFIPWLVRITRNACIDRLRRRRARPPTSSVPVEEFSALRSAGPDPDQVWRRSRRRALVHAALERLSPVNREMILLKEIEGLTLEEVAEALRIPIGTAKSRSSRARLELARAILAAGGGAVAPGGDEA